MAVAATLNYLPLFFKSKNVAILNGLITLSTVTVHTAYSDFAYNCPCSPGRNYYYGLAVIGVPALGFLLVGIMMNKKTWELVSECRPASSRKVSGSAVFASLRTIIGRALVAPLTWTVISLLRGQAYTCALCEFVDPSTIEDLPRHTEPDVLAKFPCEGTVPEDLRKFWPVVERRLKYESQLFGWLLVAGMSLVIFLILCIKHCSSTLGYQEEVYWALYRSNKKNLFERTANVHSRLLAAEDVKNFFGFVSQDKGEEEENKEHQQLQTKSITTYDWNRVTGVYLYREEKDSPWKTASTDGTD